MRLYTVTHVFQNSRLISRAIDGSHSPDMTIQVSEEGSKLIFTYLTSRLDRLTGSPFFTVQSSILLKWWDCACHITIVVRQQEHARSGNKDSAMLRSQSMYKLQRRLTLASANRTQHSILSYVSSPRGLSEHPKASNAA